VSKADLATAAARRAAAAKERDGQPRPLLLDQGDGLDILLLLADA
jgi:hypothetical protein